MKLKKKTIRELAEMVTGGASGSDTPTNFLYRTGSGLSQFFLNCDTDFQHIGSSRVPWARDVLSEINEGPASNPQLPADQMVRVLEELIDPAEYERRGADYEAALKDLNGTLAREGLQVYVDGARRCHVRAGLVTSATMNLQARLWTQRELKLREDWASYLETASEDDFTEYVLVPLLKLCGFVQVVVAGHKEKILEFGKDLRMKLQLPTGHWLYFAVQVKKGKIDSAGKSKTGNENVTEVLNQARMALDHPVHDSDVNKRVLVDHVYIIATADVTKQARQFIGEKLDADSRRQIIFMDREEILDLVAKTSIEVPAPF